MISYVCAVSLIWATTHWLFFIEEAIMFSFRENPSLTLYLIIVHNAEFLVQMSNLFPSITTTRMQRGFYLHTDYSEHHLQAMKKTQC